MTWPLTATSLQRIRAWFNNHTGSRSKSSKHARRANVVAPSAVAKIRTSGKAPRDPLSGHFLADSSAPRPKQQLQPWQAYSVLNYRVGKKLKDKIDREWNNKTEEDKELKDVPGAFLRYRNMRMEQLLAEETDEVKAKVELFRKKQKEENTPAISPFLLPDEILLSDEERHARILWRQVQRCVESLSPHPVRLTDGLLLVFSAIENMETTGEYLADVINRYTHGVVFIHVLANEPKRGGQPAVFQCVSLSRSPSFAHATLLQVRCW